MSHGLEFLGQFRGAFARPAHGVILGRHGWGGSTKNSRSFNIKDFSALVIQYPQHNGIISASQRSWNLSDPIEALDRLLSETQSEEWLGQIRWLNQWR